MPEKRTVQRARKAARRGKSASTQAGEYVRTEIRHVRRGKHGARSRKQTVAIGLNKARRAGVKVKPKRARKASASATRRRTTSSYRTRSRAHGRKATSRRTSSRSTRSRSSMRSLTSRRTARSR